MVNSHTDILVKMGSMYEHMSKSEKKILAYVMKHPDEVVSLSVSGLAEKSGVSDATVVRTSRKLGLSSYQELKVSIAKSTVEPIKTIHESIDVEDDPDVIIHKVFEGTIYTLQYTLNALDMNALRESADLLNAANKVLIFGLGNSHAIALDAQHKLMRLGISATAYADSHMQILAATETTPADVVLAISHSGSSRDVVEAVKICKENNTKSIGITSIGRNPLGKLVDITLTTASRETSYKISALSSRAAQIAIIDSIYTLIAFHHRDSMSERFNRIDRCMQKKKF